MVSPDSMRTGWSRLAMRESADSGSPCEPVEIMQTCLSGSASISRASTTRPGGTRSRPRSRATAMLRTIERPTNATVRSWACAASSTCCTRWTWLAKQATMTRRSEVRNTSSSTGAISRSLVTNPGTSALVESDSSRSIALAPEPGEAAEVGDATVERELIHLEVAGVQDVPAAVRIATRQRIRNRVVDGEELAVERPEAGPRPPR